MATDRLRQIRSLSRPTASPELVLRALAPATARQIRQRDRFFRLLPYLPAKRLIRYLSTRTATAIKLPEYPEPGPVPGSR